MEVAVPGAVVCSARLVLRLAFGAPDQVVRRLGIDRRMIHLARHVANRSRFDLVRHGSGLGW